MPIGFPAEPDALYRDIEGESPTFQIRSAHLTLHRQGQAHLNIGGCAKSARGTDCNQIDIAVRAAGQAAPERQATPIQTRSQALIV
jgi:hypothetical protein